MAGNGWTRREFLKGSGVAVGALVLGGCAPTGGGAGGDPLEEARRSGTVQVGIAGEAPYGFTDQTGRVTGEAPEVARAVFGNLGVGTVNASQVDFNQLIPALNANKFSVVAAGMFITPERCKNAAFSIPDYIAPTAFLVPRGNPDGIATFEDVVRKKLNVAVLSGAVEKDYAQRLGVPDSQVQPFDSQNSLLQAVVNRRVHCAALTNISLNDLVQKNPGAQVEVTRGFTPVIAGKPEVQAGAFVFRSADTGLRDAFNAELKKLQDSGEWVRIASPFGFTRENLPPPGVTTEALCAGS
ncbi:polar amino acid transport system substrate-binding protein [Saccharopolyspora antimicrobica]|uniref:Amino acid ABC transporter substrate-binding protein (PAAT family) n=1 Tax=Saccharopolyspora antimicrobica TaxID=455193 RepID=A0A1I5KHF3_9PSEU|nr:ectoine/hydroxyectoine ABC transporter substrate-binding protein EhuB [Saccharopolyspora antimicrobica]RKT85683.1 amino acid ABC transporter substrate-binding protein (PAAT family) [Saccharopolyspora antimicrobica]SFO84418.1 polar amino acid transport system substrate-binding protein [Saccharopolyspora antimicrobica]